MLTKSSLNNDIPTRIENEIYPLLDSMKSPWVTYVEVTFPERDKEMNRIMQDWFAILMTRVLGIISRPLEEMALRTGFEPAIYLKKEGCHWGCLKTRG